MAVKMYYNLERRAFNITQGTGQPQIIIPNTPKLWLEEAIGDKYPMWFKPVETDIEEAFMFVQDDDGDIDLEIDFDEDFGDMEIEFIPEEKELEFEFVQDDDGDTDLEIDFDEDFGDMEIEFIPEN